MKPGNRSSTLTATWAALVLAVAYVPGAIAGDESDGDIAMGHSFVAENCARCHAVEAQGDSPLAEAPPFRNLHHKYPVESLAEALAEGIVTGHADMPEFVLTPDEIGAVISYLEAGGYLGG